MTDGRDRLDDREIAVDLTERVRLELIGLLWRTDEVDLGTIYRELGALLGPVAAPAVGVVIGRLVRGHAIAIRTRQLTPDGPWVGIARLVHAVELPHHARVTSTGSAARMKHTTGGGT